MKRKDVLELPWPRHKTELVAHVALIRLISSSIMFILTF